MNYQWPLKEKCWLTHIKSFSGKTLDSVSQILMWSRIEKTAHSQGSSHLKQMWDLKGK